MLNACKQNNLAEKLNNELQSITVDLHRNSLKKQFNNLVFHYFYTCQKFFTIFRDKNTLRSSYLVKIRRFGFFRIITPITQILHTYENKFGHFLPYRFSSINNDDFFSEIQKLVREENINNALIIGGFNKEGSIETLLAGIRANSNKQTVFWININTPRFAKLQKCYVNDSLVRFYNVSYATHENFSNTLENTIKTIHQDNKNTCIDVVLINSSQFKNRIDLDIIVAAKISIFDGINTQETYNQICLLLNNSNYEMIAQNSSLRNGYAIFRRVDYEVNNSYNSSMIQDAL
jgi:hypothetical protein